MPGEGNLPYLFAAYAVIWLAFFAYLFAMSRRQRELERELSTLRRALEERAKGSPAPRQ